MMINNYIVSQDNKSGLWYCHMKGFPYIPCFGSFCEIKSDAMEYAKKEVIPNVDGVHYWADNYQGNPINEFSPERVIAWRKKPEPYRPERSEE